MQLLPIDPAADHSAPMFSTPECQEVLTIYRDYYPKVSFDPPWISYFAVRDGQVVGSCGFKEPPRDGRVEIAYWTFERFERQGVASESCRLLVELSLKTDPDLVITARTLPEDNASTRILKRNGFEFAGEVVDPEDGVVWEWVYSK